ncbi:hypothetical protein FHX77_000075 [Bifidobacterium commune]|uniref:DUF3027 domain-containing protein n=1 Tax=Bifidobacterium commune TaxID=1505727 RepID=A0A1C4H0W5_9BIFI|nr:DUF3027 domain-containing protein [Bifidobacterium commune]MBB2954695.1 hypothetical protein [Bifidobacterium commune]SCC78574.1 Protein of unknown function [Bifidobacterium commune]
MTQATTQVDEQDVENDVDPRVLAQSVVLFAADETEEVGEYLQSIDLGDNVTDFRFRCLKKGYEGWQWSVTLYHDIEMNSWSVNESSLVPTDDSLLAPAWVPWKDRLKASDLSVTDSLGTDPDDPRMEVGVDEAQGAEVDLMQIGGINQNNELSPADIKSENDDNRSGNSVFADQQVSRDSGLDGNNDTEHAQTANDGDSDVSDQISQAEVAREECKRELEDVVEQYGLSRRHVMSELGRSQTAKRWYEGQHGPKSLSTKTAEGNLCSTCAFFIGLRGDLNTMFGVCANRWSPDDGRVVSLDHGCGEHSEIEQPEPSQLWIQSKPAFDDLHIDIISQAPREERDQVELIEALDVDVTCESVEDEQKATESDIIAQVVSDESADDAESDMKLGTVGSEVAADVQIEETVDLVEAESSDDRGENETDDSNESDSSSKKHASDEETEPKSV